MAHPREALLAQSGRTVPLGSIYLDNAPVMGGMAMFHWQLIKKPQLPTLGVFAYQNGVLVYIAELGVSRDLTGSGGVPMTSEASSAMPGHLDPTIPASCSAVLWDERGGGQQPVVISNAVSFTVVP